MLLDSSDLTLLARFLDRLTGSLDDLNVSIGETTVYAHGEAVGTVLVRDGVYQFSQDGV
jgi:hypothetical protein